MTDNFIEESSSGKKYYDITNSFKKSDFEEFDAIKVYVSSKILKMDCEIIYYKPEKSSNKIKGLQSIYYKKNPEFSYTNRFFTMTIHNAFSEINDIIRGISAYMPDKYEIYGIINPSKNSLKGIKTAVYGKKSHRNDMINYLENSVRRMI